MNTLFSLLLFWKKRVNILQHFGVMSFSWMHSLIDLFCHKRSSTTTRRFRIWIIFNLKPQILYFKSFANVLYLKCRTHQGICKFNSCSFQKLIRQLITQNLRPFILNQTKPHSFYQEPQTSSSQVILMLF